MKNNIITRVAFLLTVAILSVTCGKTYMEEAQDGYDATMVVPSIVSTSGPSLALQTKTYDFKVTYMRAGSTWNWSATDATIKTVSDDKRTASVLFDVKPANDTALISVTETTVGGVISAAKVLKVKVAPFCPLETAGFVGTWSGTDGYGEDIYPSEVVTSTPSGTTIVVSGLNRGWIQDYWGEPIIEGGTIIMSVKDDGTVSIADQYCFTTTYDGDPYRYWMKGSGTWSNCGTHPTIKLAYNVYYESDGYTMPSNTNRALKFTADIVLDGGAGKSAFLGTSKSNVVSPSLKHK